MAKQYRALISVPITASDDDEARRIANECAGSVRDPTEPHSANGHVELVGEVSSDSLLIRRVVHAEALFLRQLPPDWKA